MNANMITEPLTSYHYIIEKAYLQLLYSLQEDI